MEDHRKPSLPQLSSMPIFSRLDHLDFVMKYLERKQNLSKSSSEAAAAIAMAEIRPQCVPLDSALKDSYFKGSLLDRVAALEHRLFQLCLEMDSGSSSNPSSSFTSAHASAEISSPKQCWRGEPSSSYPTFHYPSHGNAHISQVQERPERQRQKKKQQSPPKLQLGKTRTRKEEGSCKAVKKGISPKWPHLRMFGC